MHPDLDLKDILSKGPMRSGEMAASGLPRWRLSRLVAEGRIIQLARGLYALAEDLPQEFDSMVLASRQAPKAVVCLLSALQFHGLTTQMPRDIWMALEGRAYSPKVTGIRVNFHRFTGDGFHEGIEEHFVSGVPVRIYGVAKTVLDCFRMRNKIGLDIAIEALRDSLRQRKTTLQELDDLSGRLRIRSVVRPYLEMEAAS